jgi:hypothetical protein
VQVIPFQLKSLTSVLIVLILLVIYVVWMFVFLSTIRLRRYLLSLNIVWLKMYPFFLVSALTIELRILVELLLLFYYFDFDVSFY